MQTLLTCFVTRFQTKFLLLITRLQTYLYFSNRPNQLIRQYFTRQLVQVCLFANILPLQNFPTYGIWSAKIDAELLCCPESANHKDHADRQHITKIHM